MGPAPTMITSMVCPFVTLESVIVTLRMLSSVTRAVRGRAVTVRDRPYHSTLRDEQAQATRRRIVRAGGELYVERGYGPTTIDAIAERAEVSRKTVFTSVGGKAAVLKLAFDWALAGDDEPVAIADRPEVRRMMHEQDPASPPRPSGSR